MTVIGCKMDIFEAVVEETLSSNFGQSGLSSLVLTGQAAEH